MLGQVFQDSHLLASFLAGEECDTLALIAVAAVIVLLAALHMIQSQTIRIHK